jgi:hypothetical protein
MEQYMKTLKDYVSTYVYRERSMVEDTLGFFTKYILLFSTMRRGMWDKNEEPSMFDEELEGGRGKRSVTLDRQN